MTFYLDASAVLPTLVFEASTDAVGNFLGALTKPPVLSELCVGEVGASLARLVRMRVLDSDDAQQRLIDFDRWCATSIEAIDTEPADVRLASLLVRDFDLKLRMPDAIHAAACRRLGLTLVTLDQRLAAAAKILEVETIVPGNAYIAP